MGVFKSAYKYFWISKLLHKLWTNYVYLCYKSAHKIQNRIKLWVFRLSWFMKFRVKTETISSKLMWSWGTGVYLYTCTCIRKLWNFTLGGYSACGYLKYFDKNAECMCMHIY